MNKLDKAITYLVGPIDNAADHGRGWRQQFVDLIAEKNIPLKVLDPTNKPNGQLSEGLPEKEFMLKLKQENRWMDLKNFVHQMRRTDLRFTDYADVIVAYIDPTVHMCGSYWELASAENQHKPIFLIINGGKQACPNWLFDVVGIDRMFDDVESCVSSLDNIDKGRVATCDQWVLVKQHLYI